MHRYHHSLFASVSTAACLGLAACVATPEPTPTLTNPPARSSADCNAAEVQAGFVGRTASDEVVREAVRATGASSVRVLGPDDMATMDYVTSRLNVLVDANRVIRQLRCG